MLLNVAGKGRPFHWDLVFCLVVLFSTGSLHIAMADVWTPPPNGFATITYYTLPLDYIASGTGFISLGTLV